MANFVKTSLDLVTKTIGVVEQTVVEPTSCLGDDAVLLIIENLSGVETFNGYAWASPNGVSQWNVEENDNFQGILPGKTRRMLLAADRLYVRVLGSFAGAPANVRITVIMLRAASRRG